MRKIILLGINHRLGRKQWTFPCAMLVAWLSCVTLVSQAGGAQQIPTQQQMREVGPTLAAITLNPTSATGGSTVRGTLTLTGPAPSGGFVVSLSSSDTAVVTVPAQVAIRPRASSATFTVKTNPIGTNPNVVPPPASVVISASHFLIDPVTRRQQQVTKTATLTVLPPVVHQVGMLIIRCFPKGGSTGGTPLKGCVILTGPAAFRARGEVVVPLGGGASVNLSSSNPALAGVPERVLVPAGQTGVNFEITTIPVAQDTPVTISAHRTQSGNKTATLTVLAPRLQDLTLSQPSVTGGAIPIGTVKLTGPVASNAQVVVNLTSSNQQVASVPPNVTLIATEVTKTFNIQTSPVTTDTPVTISASYLGATEPVTLTVFAPRLSSLTCTPAGVTGGNPVSCSVRLTGPVASGAQVDVSLSSSRPELAPVPASVRVHGGELAGTFTIPTRGVANATSVTITASHGGTKTATLGLGPASLIQFLLNGWAQLQIPSPLYPQTVTVTGWIGLDGQPPPGGADVFLDGHNPGSGVVATVTYPASPHVPETATGVSFPLIVQSCGPIDPAYFDPYCGIRIRATYKGRVMEATLAVRSQ